jgi:hypothetical protein
MGQWETVCARAEFGGYSKNGGFAEYILADPNYVAHVPGGLSAAQAAPIICAGDWEGWLDFFLDGVATAQRRYGQNFSCSRSATSSTQRSARKSAPRHAVVPW